MIWNLLADEAPNNSWLMYVLIGVLVVGLVVWFIVSGRKNRGLEKEYTEQLDAIKPGNKVISKAGLCGIVVEVCDEDNSVIVETGSEQSGKSYFKLLKECIYQTDAKGPTQLAREALEAKKAAEKANKEAIKRGEAPKEIPGPVQVGAPEEKQQAPEADPADPPADQKS